MKRNKIIALTTLGVCAGAIVFNLTIVQANRNSVEQKKRFLTCKCDTLESQHCVVDGDGKVCATNTTNCSSFDTNCK